MSDQINSFFESGMPAQINQIDAAQTGNLQENIQQASQQPMATLQDLPAPEVEAAPETVQESAPVQQAPEEPQLVKETGPQKSFREQRERMLKAEWERDELARRIQTYESSGIQRAPQARPVEEEDDLGIAPDDIIEGKHLAKIIKTVEKRTERKVMQQQEAMMQIMTENRLKTEMPDLDSVVNQDTLKTLRSMYPELAQSINTNPDLYSKAKSAYTLIKKLNIVEPAPSYDYQQDRARIQQNMAKPKPVQSVAQRQSPLAQSVAYDGELTEGMKAQLWKEMNVARNK